MSQLKLGVQCAGSFKITKHSANRPPETYEFPNLITNLGLNRLAQGVGPSYCYVGTGTGTPAVTDTNLFVPLANSPIGTVGGSSNAGAPTYRSRLTITYQFGLGVAAGNLTEIGVGWNANPSGNLFSHALIVDSMGNPTTITVFPDEYLTVVYIFDVYPPLVDVVQTGVTIGPGTHDITTRAAEVGSWNVNAIWSSGIGIYLAHSTNGTIGAITGAPSGAQSSTGAVSNTTYVTNSFTRQINAQFGLTEGNFATGISALRFQYSYAGSAGSALQAQVTPPIMKTNEDVLDLSFSITWSRYTP